MSRDPAVDRFLARHALSEREAILADAAPYVAMTPDERARHVDLACRLAAEALQASPFREAILARREPPHPSYFEIVRRLRRGACPPSST